jgi:hypothetical protein
MYSNHIQVTTGSKNLLLADFWVQSELPMSTSERAHVVNQMGWDSNTVHHKTLEVLLIDGDRPGHMTLIEATIPLPSYKLIQLDNGEKCWQDERWYNCGFVDAPLTEAEAYNKAVEWALFDGFDESSVIGQIKVTVRYVEKFALATHADDPF